MTPSLDDYRWLTSDKARSWLARAAADLAGGVPLTRLTTQLRRDLTPAQAHLVLEQVDLRRRARAKFSLADDMFFTPQGLVQATDESLAEYKATRFLSDGRVADLCCGIGGDLIALSDGRNCLGVDRDPVLAHLAMENAAVFGRNGVSVACREVADDVFGDASAWHIDPDRRPEGKRTVRAERFEPPWEVVESLLSSCRQGAVKVAPATELPFDVSTRCEREWIESRGECRQQVAWFGRLAHHPGRCTATVIDAAGGTASVSGLFDESPPLSDVVGSYVYEPCAAVRAARLTAAICRRGELTALSNGRSYLTGEHAVRDPLVAGFEVLESLPFDLRRLTAALKQLGIEPAEIKKRGSEIDPAELRRKLKDCHGQTGVVLIAPIGGRTMAIIARRLR